MAKKTDNKNLCNCCNPYICGVFLVIIGVYLLATQMGWIPRDIPFWPIILIIIGIYLLRKYKK